MPYGRHLYAVERFLHHHLEAESSEIAELTRDAVCLLDGCGLSGSDGH